MTPTVRKFLVIAAVVFAIAVPAVQMGLGLGLSAAEFAADGDGTLRAAPYAFGIWSVIYAGMVGYAVWQALPRNTGDPRLAAIAWPSIVAITGCGLWICASALDWKWASVAIIVGSAAALVTGLLRVLRAPARRGWQALAFVWWPLGLLAGWLTIAAALNILTVLTAQGLLNGQPAAAAFAGILVVLAVGLAVLRGSRLPAYGVPIAWGLVAVWVAERASKGDVAALALGSAAVVGAYAVWQARPRATRSS